MNSEHIIPLVLVIFIAYSFWRRSAAITARSIIAPSINDYLGGEHPDELKDMVYQSFNHSLSNLVPIIAMLVFFIKLFSKERSVFVILQSKYGKNETKIARHLIFKTISVNIFLSPILYLVFAFAIATTLVIKIIFTLATNPSRLAKTFKSKLDSSMIQAVG